MLTLQLSPEEVSIDAQNTRCNCCDVQLREFQMYGLRAAMAATWMPTVEAVLAYPVCGWTGLDSPWVRALGWVCHHFLVAAECGVLWLSAFCHWFSCFCPFKSGDREDLKILSAAFRDATVFVQTSTKYAAALMTRVRQTYKGKASQCATFLLSFVLPIFVQPPLFICAFVYFFMRTLLHRFVPELFG